MYLKYSFFILGFHLLSVAVLRSQPAVIDGHSHMVLYHEDGEIFVRTGDLAEKGFSGIFYALPVNRTETKNMTGRLLGEMEQIRKLLTPDQSLKVYFAVEFFGGLFPDPERLIPAMQRMEIRYVTLIDDVGDKLFEGDLLTGKGKEVVDMLNQHGLAIDVSHLYENQILQVLERSKMPVIASHSACYEATPLRRNLTDRVIASIAEGGGLILISFNTIALFQEEEIKVDGVKRFADHLIHAVSIAGIDHVGIGTDLQANGRYVSSDLWTDHTIQDIKNELSSRGMVSEDITRLFSENLNNFFKLTKP